MPRRAAALCSRRGHFFHCLLRGPRPLDRLVSAIGYDVKLEDTCRIAMVKSSVRTVAAEIGIPAVFITSNLRRHAISGRRRLGTLAWSRAGGAGAPAWQPGGPADHRGDHAREDDQPLARGGTSTRFLIANPGDQPYRRRVVAHRKARKESPRRTSSAGTCVCAGRAATRRRTVAAARSACGPC